MIFILSDTSFEQIYKLTKQSSENLFENNSKGFLIHIFPVPPNAPFAFLSKTSYSIGHNSTNSSKYENSS